MSESASPAYLTFEEYLELEARSEIRHEFSGGEMYAMTGGSLRHSQVVLSFAAALLPDARNQGCRLYVADAKLRIGDAAYYPDVMAVCDAPRDDDRFETAPCLLVEVLSRSTQLTDRRHKLAAYLSVPSLRHYLIVDPEAMVIEVRTRVEDRWTLTRFGLGEELTLSCPRTLISVDAVFHDLF